MDSRVTERDLLNVKNVTLHVNMPFGTFTNHKKKRVCFTSLLTLPFSSEPSQGDRGKRTQQAKSVYWSRGVWLTLWKMLENVFVSTQRELQVGENYSSEVIGVILAFDWGLQIFNQKTSASTWDVIRLLYAKCYTNNKWQESLAGAAPFFTFFV